MKIGLFIPCYIDQFYPQAGIATYKLLVRLGLDVDFHTQQTCCGQPVANAGFEAYGGDALRHFADNFKRYDYIVAPSGSCVLHVKEHIGHFTEDSIGLKIKDSVFELCEFLTDIIKLENVDATFPHKVGLHNGCHGLRGLRLARASELNIPDFNKPRSLLEKVKGIQLVELTRRDECCGFGGTFSVTEEAISTRMGEDRLEDHLAHGAEYITSTDTSCMMHLEGLARRRKDSVRFVHIAEILNQQ